MSHGTDTLVQSHCYFPLAFSPNSTRRRIGGRVGAILSLTLYFTEGLAHSSLRVACDMEDPLQRIRNFTAALARLAPTIDDGGAAAIIQECTLAITESLEPLDESHGYFFELHHPERERFEREGWPAEQAEELT
jgi:hypothetical protein